MHADKRFDDALSGTTAISVLFRGRTMFISNGRPPRGQAAVHRPNTIQKGTYSTTIYSMYVGRYL